MDVVERGSSFKQYSTEGESTRTTMTTTILNDDELLGQSTRIIGPEDNEDIEALAEWMLLIKLLY
ncbi:hypothetical protein KIN20_037950 [Parelaphostrongylus tenuis]|uniref:Uncharacterized protein n=1 Tax=Parelaphostrongylus tenuis TaxID=148309 RepID=A0AAD5RE83_PARTN|nr:hypothetical protein KIN20_037950 [Parelaphostrongylus tenuis]